MIYHISKNLLIVVVLFLLLGGSFKVFSQDLTSTSGDLAKEEFNVELTSSTQSPINGTVPLKFTVKSKLESKTAFIRWEASEDVEFLKRDEVEFSLKKDETYVFEQSVKPLKPGTYRITAVAEAWRPEANYLGSDQINLEFNEKLEVIPITEDYKSASMIWLIARIFIFALLAALAVFGGLFGFKAFQKWLSKD